MANTVNIDLRIKSDSTLAEQAKLAKEFAEANRDAAKSIREIEAAQRLQKKIVQSQGRSNSSAGVSTASNRDLDSERAGYRQFRGASGTGAAGRDFGKQAEGLGGLVRVYATFAANIFALTAAFSALSKAADTSNMVRGLDQLGAASGRNLSTLAKGLVDVSDGAISLREAMTAVAQGTAGGLDGGQLMRLTEVAKKASQALGRNLPDALTRLTSGITKIEPELLDELGIIVKVDMANQAYARSLGKTANSLTDLEKRQAFATEAISQGEKKFKDIEMASNPYAKILASTADLTQRTLELVNKVLSPIVDIMSKSPTALAVAIASIAGLLLKQALPALGQWRQGLEKAAEASRNTAIQINKDFKSYQAAGMEKTANLVAAQISSQKAALDTQIKSMTESAANGVGNVRSAIGQILVRGTKDVASITSADIAKLESQVKSFNTKAANAAKRSVDPSGSADYSKSQKERSDAYAAQAKALQDSINTIPKLKQAEEDLNNARTAAQKQHEASQSRFSEASQRQRIADRANAQAAKAEVLSNVGTNTQTQGVRGAWTSLFQDIKKGRAEIGKVGEEGYAAARAPLTGLNALATGVRGAFTIATSAATTFLNAFGVWITIIPLALAGLSALSDYFRTNLKESKAFYDSVDVLNGAVKTVGDTLDAIASKPFLEQLSVDTILAKATAIYELNGAIQATFKNLIQADKMSGSWDKFLDGWKTLWGGDLRTTASKSIASAVSKGLGAITDGPTKEKAVKELGELFGSGTEISESGIFLALKNAGSIPEFISKYEQLVAINDKFATSTKQSADGLMAVNNAITETSKAVSTITSGLSLTDPMAKLGSSILAQSTAISSALEKGPIGSIVILKKLLNEPSTGFLPPEIFSKLNALRDGATKTSKEITEAGQKLIKIQNEADVARKNIPSNPRSLEHAEGMMLQKNFEDRIKQQQDALTKAREEEKKLADQLAAINKSTFEYGAQLIRTSLKSAFEQAALGIAKSAAAGISGGGSADLELKLRLQEISVQERVIIASMEVAKNLFVNSLALEKARASDEKNTLNAKLSVQGAGALSPTERAGTQESIKKLDTTLETLTTSIDLISKFGGNTKKLLAAGTGQSAQVSAITQSFASQQYGGEAALAGTRGQKTEAVNTAAVKTIKEKLDANLRTNDAQKKNNDLAARELEILKQNNKISEENYIISSNEIQVNAKKLETQSEVLKLTADIAEQERRIADVKKTGLAGVSPEMAAELKAKQEQLAGVKARGGADVADITESNRLKLIELIAVKQDQMAKAQIEARLVYNTITEESAQREIANIERAAIARKTGSENELAIYNMKNDALVQQTEQLQKQEKLMRSLGSLSEMLGKMFGGIGKTLGGVAVAIGKTFAGGSIEKLLQTSANKQVEIEKKKQGKIEQLESLGYTKAQAGQIADREFARESAQEKIGLAGDVAGEIANSFDQQSAAARVFHKVEQAFHIAKLAMQAEALISSITVAGIQEALASSVALAWIPAVWAQSFGQLGPIAGAIAGAAAVAVIFAAMGGGGGGSAPKVGSQDLQAAQGTGKTYNSEGKLVANGGGALGDTSKKSEAVAKAIETLGETNFESLDFQKGPMYQALLDIRDNTAQFAKAIIATTGLVSGNSSFGTTEGASKTNLWNTFFSKTSTTILDTGIKIIGSIGDLMKGQGTTSQYEDVKSTKSSFFGLVKSDNFSRNEQALEDQAQKYIKGIFTGFNTAISSAADSFGTTASDIQAKLQGININISTSAKGLTGQEFADAVMAQIGIELDKAANTVLPGFKELSEQFQQLGESSFEFVARLVNDSKNVNLALSSIGKKLLPIGIDGLKMSQALVKASGSLDEFVSLTNNFAENFLSDAERLAPVQKAVTEELARLGYAGIDTMESLKNVILAQEVLTEEGATTYAGLLKVSSAFAEVYGSTKKVTLSTKELAEAQEDQLVKIYDLLGYKSLSLALTRKRELDAMDKLLRPTQEYIYALTDEVNARQALRDAYTEESDARTTALDTLKTTRDSLLEFSKSLSLGAQSPLTPGQKYKVATDELNKIKEVINSTTATKEEKGSAFDKLQNAIGAQLDASKVYYASSDQYQRDYKDAQDFLVSNAEKLSGQITIEEDSLKQLKDSVTKLGGIEDGVKSVADAIRELVEAQKETNEKLLALGGGTGSNAGFIANKYATTPGLSSADKEGQQFWTGALEGGKVTTGQVDSLINSELMVKSWYAKVLNREPDKAGLNFWLNAARNESNLASVKEGFALGAAAELGVPRSSIPAFKNGGLGLGTALVGEEGPELVNFQNPGRVYTNGQSGSMFSELANTMGKELAALRAEVALLRNENNRNAGLVIKSNYEANQAAANQVAEAVTDTGSKTDWNQTRNPSVAY